MKYLPLVIFTVLSMVYSSDIQAQESLSQEEKEEAKAWAQKFQKDRHENRNVDFGKIKPILLTACSSEKAAVDLYLEAKKLSLMNSESSILDNYRIVSNNEENLWSKIRHNSLKLKTQTSQFTDWKKENTDRNNNPEFRKALQIHLRWLLIYLRKNEAVQQEKELDIRPDVMELLNEYISQIEKLVVPIIDSHSVLSLVKDYLKVDKWESFSDDNMPGSILDLDFIFEKVFYPSLKESKDVEGFRKMGAKNIAMNIALLKALAKHKEGAPEQDKLEIADYALNMQMEIECDCYQLGDEVRAVDNFKKIIISIRKPKIKKEAIEKMENLLNSKEIKEKNRIKFRTA